MCPVRVLINCPWHGRLVRQICSLRNKSLKLRSQVNMTFRVVNADCTVPENAASQRTFKNGAHIFAVVPFANDRHRLDNVYDLHVVF